MSYGEPHGLPIKNVGARITNRQIAELIELSKRQYAALKAKQQAFGSK